MSGQKGDRARFDRERRKKVLRRQRTRKLLKAAEGKRAGGMPDPALCENHMPPPGHTDERGTAKPVG